MLFFVPPSFLSRAVVSAIWLTVSATAATAQISFDLGCADKVICLNQGSCSDGLVNSTVTASTLSCASQIVSISYKIDFGSNGSIDLQGNGGTVNQNFPLGNSRINWRATDNCGNATSCTQNITVKDCNAPNLLCINGLTQSLDASCNLSFNAQSFVLSVSDNCTPTNQLQYGIRRFGEGTGFPTATSLSFNECDGGTNIVEIWVRDGNGLANQCSNYVLVQNNSGNCPCITESTVTLKGCARTGGNRKLTNYQVNSVVESVGTNGLVSGTLKTKGLTSNDSCYNLFVNTLPLNAHFRTTLRAKKVDDPTNGFTTYDLVLINRHILNLEPFTSFYQTVAGDVNNSQTVTTFDIVEGRKVLLGIYDTFPNVPAWRFIRPVPNPSDLIAWASMKDYYSFDNVNLNGDTVANSLNWVAVKVGDINGGASFTGEIDDRDGAPLVLTAADRLLEANTTVRIPLRLAETAQLAGWQMSLRANPIFGTITATEGLPDDAWHLLPDGSLRCVWLDDSGSTRTVGSDADLFVLEIKVLRACTVAQLLSLDDENTLLPEATTAGQVRRPLTLQLGAANASNDVRCFPPSPNPFADQTQIGVLTTAASAARLDIFDLTGRAVYTQQLSLDSGYQTVSVAANNLPAAGVFTYRLTVGATVFAGKLVRL